MYMSIGALIATNVFMSERVWGLALASMAEKQLVGYGLDIWSQYHEAAR
jgi:hypothetical protein